MGRFSKEQFDQRIIEIIAMITGNPEGDVRDDVELGVRLFSDIGSDSLSKLDALSQIQEEFGITFDDAIFDKDCTVKEVLDNAREKYFTSLAASAVPA